jgi:hypothetical protein
VEGTQKAIFRVNPDGFRNTLVVLGRKGEAVLLPTRGDPQLKNATPIVKRPATEEPGAAAVAPGGSVPAVTDAAGAFLADPSERSIPLR